MRQVPREYRGGGERHLQPILCGIPGRSGSVELHAECRWDTEQFNSQAGRADGTSVSGVQRDFAEWVREMVETETNASCTTPPAPGLPRVGTIRASRWWFLAERAPAMWS